jgi:uncharacterized protein
MESYLLIVLLGVVAFLYASVGHGGASGYIALLVIFHFTPEVIKPAALVLNLVVSAIAFIQFYRAGYFQWKLLMPFILLSFPLSYLGSWIKVDAQMYKFILAGMLFIAVLRLLIPFGNKEANELRKPNFLLAMLIGGAIGFVSGMIGIGGGIILSPIILILGWADIKQTAAVSAAFIFINSIAGLAGIQNQGIENPERLIGWAAACAIGGMIGARYGSVKWNTKTLRFVLATVLIFACFKLVLV